MTLSGGDAPAYFLDFVAEPDFLEIVVVVPQIAEIIGTHATGPDSPIGIDMRTYPAGVTIDDLIFFVQDALDQLVVFHTKRFGDLGHASELLTLDIDNDPIDRLLANFHATRDMQAHRIHSNPR